METNCVHTDDAFDVLPTLDANSVHAVVTDPPYGLAFMGRSWDDFEPTEYQEWCEEWAAEVKRVLKPGGHLLAFSGNRTHHRLFSGVEDSGFEIRDTITWHYGSGFPKALDVSKAIDKQAGGERKDIAETLREARSDAELSREELAERVGCAPSSIRDWEEGRARSEGEPVEWVVPSPEYREKLASVLPEYPTEAEREVVGSYEEGERNGVFNDETSGFGSGERTVSETDAAERWDGFKTALKPATEYVVVARTPLSEGTVAENVQTHGAGALNIDGTRIGTEKRTNPPTSHNDNCYADAGDRPEETVEGRYPSNVVFDEREAERLDRENGELGGGQFKQHSDVQVDAESHSTDEGYDRPGNTMYAGEQPEGVRSYGDAGGPSRYFYTSKASRSERTLDGKIDNAHPTVKPADLMEWLVTLVTAEEQIVLDPFAGTGTTCRAAKDTNRRFVGIERQDKWADVARVRCGLNPVDPSHVRSDDAQQGFEAYTDD